MASQKTGIAPPNSSGIKVIVVGLGYAGAVAAVECFRKGRPPMFLKEVQNPSVSTLMVRRHDITANAAHIIAKWGDGSVHQQFQEVFCRMDEFSL